MHEPQLAAIVEPILTEAGLELDCLDITPLGKRKLLRITVDGDGPLGRGPTLDEISAASAKVSAALDSSTAVGNAPYTLEVSSRGVSAPLTQPKHFRRNQGRLVSVRLSEGELTGRILEVSEVGVDLEVKGSRQAVAFDQITSAKVQIEMNPPKEFALPGDEIQED